MPAGLALTRCAASVQDVCRRNAVPEACQLLESLEAMAGSGAFGPAGAPPVQDEDEKDHGRSTDASGR